jgi:RNA 3'-terminal phosphate cyclase (ATP)
LSLFIKGEKTMDGFLALERVNWPHLRVAEIGSKPRRWMAHSAHRTVTAPHRSNRPWGAAREEFKVISSEAESSHGELDRVVLDGSRGEGGGQILRTALTLSLLTGRPFRMVKIRANRDKPGLRPQHQKALEAAAALGEARVTGGGVGARELTFAPAAYVPRDFSIDIGTAGSTGLVLQTLHLALTLRSEKPTRLVLTGGTFNPKAPAFPFLEATWRAYLAAFGMPLTLMMSAAGFYPRGGGQLEAQIEPATPRAFIQTQRGPLRRLSGIAGVANLRDDIARRMRDRAVERLGEHGFSAEIDLVRWPSPGQGAALYLTAEHEETVPATFVGLGERAKAAEAVADEAVAELLAFEAVQHAAVDPHSADQILLPLAFAQGRSEFTVSEVTEHLRTNAETIRAFLDRSITIEEPENDDQPGRVVIG